jgi:hypothetical protein
LVPAADTKPTSLLSQLTTHVLSMVRQPSPFTFSSIGVPSGPETGLSSKLCVTSMPFCATGFPSISAITSCTPPKSSGIVNRPSSVPLASTVNFPSETVVSVYFFPRKR